MKALLTIAGIFLAAVVAHAETIECVYSNPPNARIIIKTTQLEGENHQKLAQVILPGERNRVLLYQYDSNNNFVGDNQGFFPEAAFQLTKTASGAFIESSRFVCDQSGNDDGGEGSGGSGCIAHHIQVTQHPCVIKSN